MPDAPNPQISRSRSPEVTAERPERALELLLGAWLGGDDRHEIRGAFRAAVERVAAGEDPLVAAKPAGSGERRRIVAGVLALVASCLPAARDDAERALGWAVELSERIRSEIAAAAGDEGRLRQLEADVRLAAHIGRTQPSGDLAFATAVGFARTAAFEWHDDDKPGNAATLAPENPSFVPWSLAAVAVGRRFAGLCLECGEPLSDRRIQTPNGRTARREHHERCEPPASLVKQREKAIERLVPLVAEALARRGGFGTPAVP